MPSILPKVTILISRIVLYTFLLIIVSGCSKLKEKKLEYITFSYKSYIDKSDVFSIRNYKTIPFKSIEELNYPFLKGTLWIEIRLYNEGKVIEDIIVQNNDRLNWNYKLFKVGENSDVITPNKTGNLSYIDHRSFNFSKPNFKITLAPNQKLQIYLQVKTTGKTVRATPSIVSLNQFIQVMNEDNTMNIFFYGVIFIILLINIFYWKVFKKRVYLFYILYILFTCLFYISFDGYLYGGGIPTYIVEHVVFGLFKCMILFLLLFSALFLRIKETTPKFYFFFKLYLAIVFIAIFSYQIFFCKNTIGKIHIVEYTLGFGWIALMVLMIILSIQKKNAEVKYYIFAMSFVIIAVFTGVLKVYFTSETSGRLFFKVGTTIEFIIFTYSTAIILGNKKKEAEQYKNDRNLLENKYYKLQNQILEIHNTSLSKTDVLSIFKLLESNLTNKEDWINFKDKFKEMNPNFLPNLYKKHPNLSKTEIRLLILIKIGFTQKEISCMLFIAESSVKKAKQRVRKKMGLTTGISLSTYLKYF